jgi:hypothetical protein
MAVLSLALVETWLASITACATRASSVLYWSWVIIKENAKPATKNVAPPIDIPRKKMPSFAGMGSSPLGGTRALKLPHPHVKISSIE